MSKGVKMVAVIILFLLTLTGNSMVPFNTVQPRPVQAVSSPSALAADGNGTFGVGLSGGPVVLDSNFLASLEGSPPSITNMELNVSKYFVPLGVNLVFLDIFWDNAANTSTSLVAGGFDQAVANWLQVGDLYNIKTIFFFKQFGYYFSSPSWDQNFLDAYPGAATTNSNGVNVPLSTCSAGCTSASGWTITSPDVYRQIESDLKQLYSWYGQYPSWIGFGEGATGDRNNYAGTGDSLKTSRPWDNGTISMFANSAFFQRYISVSNGDYLGTQSVSDLWSMFLKDRPDTILTVGIPEPSTSPDNVYTGKSVSERFYVPEGQNVKGFVLSAYIYTTGATPSAPLTATIYNDNGEFSNGTENIGSKVISSATVAGVTTTHQWVQISFSSAQLIAGDYYWVDFSSSTQISSPYQVEVGNYYVPPGIYTGSVLQIKSLSGQNIAIYPRLNTGANWQAVPGQPVSFEVSQVSTFNTITFYDSDRAYDPNNVTFYVTDPSNNILATGSMCSQCFQAYNSLHHVPFQLSRVVTLQPGVTYKINFNALPSTDKWSGSSGAPITQDFIADTCDPATACMLGQGYFPVFQLGLFNVDVADSSFPYAPTDLFSSPGYNHNTETSVGFVAKQNEVLTGFEINVIKADSSSSTFTVSVRSDNPNPSHHPQTGTSLATYTTTLAAINSTFVPCSMIIGSTGYCAWVNATFSGVSLTAGQYYWMVMSTNDSGSSSCTVCLMRLNNGYQFPVYDSSDDFSTNWGVPADGPSDLSFQIVTSGETINNTVQGSENYLFNLGSFAQSFEVSHSSQVKEIWSPWTPGTPYEQLKMSIETDSGSDSPSGRVLATAVNSQMLNNPVNLAPGVKYWIVWSSTCLKGGYCSNPTRIGYTTFRSDASTSINYGGMNLHTEIYNSSTSSWVKGLYNDTTFLLMDSNSTIDTYNTSTLYNEISSADGGQIAGSWNDFLDYYQTTLMYNLTQMMSGLGKPMIYYTGLQPTFGSMTNVNWSNILITNSGAGGPIGCPPTQTSCGGTSSFYNAEVGDYLSSILSNTPQSNFLMWASVGNTQDNQGDLTPLNTLNEYLTVLPETARANLLFNDWIWGIQYHGLNNMTQNQYTRAFGTLINRMVYEGDFFGTSKNAVRLLWISGGSDGSFPAYLEPAINVTITSDLNLTNTNLNQFNVIGGSGLDSLTPTAASRVQAFVQSGGGYVYNVFGESQNQENNILGLSTGSSSATVTSSLSILTPNKITNPYSTISFTPYWLRYQISKLGNESAKYLVQDSNGNPVITTNTYYSGVGVSIESPDYSRLEYVNQGDSFISLYINAVYFAAGKANMLPIMWGSTYENAPASFLYQSTDGSPGNPVLLWASNNASSAQSLDVHLNATFFGISTQGWTAIDLQNMAVVARGSGSDVHIMTTVPGNTWAPIYIMSDPNSSLQSLYSTAELISSSPSGSSETYSLSGGLNSSSWLVLSAPSVSGVSSSLTGSISSYPSLSSLNQTQIGYYCTSISGSACTSWVARSQQGYYYDSANNLLYIHYRSSESLALSVSGSGTQGSSGSTSSTSTSSASSTTSTSTSSTTKTSTTASSSSSTSASTTTTVASSSLGFISIQAGSGPYSVGNQIALSGSTLTSPTGTAVPSQTIYIWVNGQDQGGVTSSSTGAWTSSFTPTTGGTLTVSASQSSDGSGVTSQQLQLAVGQGSTSTTTSSTSQASTYSSTSSQSTTKATTSAQTTTSTQTTSTTTFQTATTAISRAAVTSTSSSTTTTTNSNTSTNYVASSSGGETSNSTNSTTPQKPNNTHSSNLISLFGSIPYITTSTPSALGTTVFAIEVGLVTSAPFVVRKMASKLRDDDDADRDDWRW